MGTYYIYNSSAASKEYLAHHGVKGMKWGVRRYQNKDGSLTSAGRRRAAKEEYRRSTNSAFERYEKTVNSIEKKYKRGQNLSDRDMARESAAEKRYSAESTAAKKAYKQAKADIKQAKKEFKADVKSVRKAASNRYTNVVDNDTGMHIGVRDNLITVANSIKTKKGKEYAERVVKKANSQLRAQAVTAIATSALVVAGAGWLSSQSY